MKAQVSLVGILRRLRNQSISLEHALLELVDNSVDANACRVCIREHEGDLIVSDNGEGFEDISTAFYIGESAKDGKIGRYGVGLKDAAVRYSDRTVIESRGIRASACWPEIIEDDNGDIQTEDIANSSETLVILEGFRDRYTRAVKTDTIRRTYTPMLQSGRLLIECNGEELKPFPLPAFTDQIDVEFTFRGRGVRLTGGIFKPCDPLRREWTGYNAYYRGRLIGPGRITSDGVGDEGCTAFAFILHLLDGDNPWQLASNKDAFEDCSELLNFCYDQYTKPLMVKGAGETQEMELKEIEDAVTNELNRRTGNQTRRPRREKQGTVAPTNTGSKKKRTNTSTDDGRYQDQGNGRTRPNAKLLFKFTHLGGDTAGEIQNQGRQIVIAFNADNPFISEHRTDYPVILGLAKTFHATHQCLKEHDTAPDNLVTSIMDSTGHELF